MSDEQDARMKLAILYGVVIVAVSSTAGMLILAAFGKEGSGALLSAMLAFQTPIIIGLLGVFQSLWKVEARLNGHTKQMEQMARKEGVEAGIEIQRQSQTEDK